MSGAAGQGEKMLGRRVWIWTRRASQALAWAMVLFAPLLGGWQRLDAVHLSRWDGQGYDLSPRVIGGLGLGESGGRVYEANRLLGAGLASDAFGVPAMDPVAGLVSFLGGNVSLRMIVAWSVPLVLALIFGRFFCGWFCPFGSLARALEKILARLHLPVGAYRLPSRRPLRWVLLGAVFIGGALGGQHIVDLLLPHFLVQQTVYALWLLGGGGALLGMAAGLVLAAVLYGPTTYCAALCPTGAALSLVGRRRLLRVQHRAPSACGVHCVACDRACWLGLRPASGDPGPDCDSCTRCFAVCPKTNLMLGRGRPAAPSRAERPAARALSVGIVVGLGLLLSGCETRPVLTKPTLLLDAMRAQGSTWVYVSAVDETGVQLSLDDEPKPPGTLVSVMMARGAPLPADERGMKALRESYDGPLGIEILRRGRRLATLEFSAPTAPRSTIHRTIYRSRTPHQLRPGDEIVVPAVAGWLEAPSRWELPEGAPGRSWSEAWWALAAGFLLFGGLVSLALAIG